MRDIARENEVYLSEFTRFESGAAANGDAWLHAIRSAAIGRFSEMGFPTTREEEWKYTSVAPIAEIGFKLAGREACGPSRQEIRTVAYRGWDCNEFVLINGHFHPELSLLEGLPQGVELVNLAHAVEARRDLVEPYLARYARYQDNAFVALNTAFMKDGAFLRVAGDRVVEKPIHLLFLARSGREPFVSHPRNLIVVGNNSQVTIVESYVGLGAGAYLTNGVTEVAVGENAVVDHCRIQREGPTAFHVATLQASQGPHSSFSCHSVSLGGSLVRNDVNIVLDGEGVDCNLDGLYLATGRQHMDTHTRIDHLKPHGTSRELYKGILDGRSRGVFNGKIVVWKDAQKTDANQINKNLLLSEEAEVNSKPQLEILADDVKCSHGTTVGQLAEEELFYLRSRGLDRLAARALLTYGFASDAVGRIKVGPVRSRLEELLASRVQRIDGDEGSIEQ